MWENGSLRGTATLSGDGDLRIANPDGTIPWRGGIVTSADVDLPVSYINGLRDQRI